MRGALITLVVLATATFGCESAAPEVDGPDDSFLGPDGKADFGDVEEGTPEACGVLRVVNEASLETLDAAPPGVGLDSRAAGNIAVHRAGPDRTEGTEDDDLFDDLQELDDISYVGPSAFRKILEYAEANDYVVGCGADPADGDADSDADSDVDSDADTDPEPETFGFFVMGDSRSHPEVLESIAAGMVELDPDAVAAFNTGDITTHGTPSQWATHLETLAAGAPDPDVPEDPLGIVRQSRLRTDVTEFGDWIRYIGVLGNHDDNNGEWFGAWNTHLPGQAHLGQNGLDGIYFSVTYGGSLFIVLDSVNPSEEQTRWLRDLLESETATEASWVFAFFHYPIYPCNGQEPFAEGLEWVELFEHHGVDIAFVAHSHTFERTCPMVGGHCEEGGVIYLNSSAAGAPVRPVYADRSDTVSWDGRTDSFDCTEILEVGQGYWDHFCHLAIDSCRLEISCYDHDWVDGGGPPFDSYVIDKCD